MKILYIFPHPDDESFGPATTIAKLKREDHHVYLLTLTKGGATKQRHKFNFSVEEMGEARHKEMLKVVEVLGIDGFKILDLPDSGLKELDPHIIEEEIKSHIEIIKPDVIITYPVHGVSGFHDHLVCHAAVKRVYCELKENGNNYLKRLAFFTIDEAVAKEMSTVHKLQFSQKDEIDCILKVSEEDKEKNRQSLDCYVTYKEMIDNTGVRKHIPDHVSFEFFRENYNPPVNDIFADLN
ncbi:MAG: PIG-L deacetylase family protein [Bacteroidia bacterium]|jgi:LmbE family N-acetylglucosaminyl deacetylase